MFLHFIKTIGQDSREVSSGHVLTDYEHMSNFICLFFAC